MFLCFIFIFITIKKIVTCPLTLNGHDASDVTCRGIFSLVYLLTTSNIFQEFIPCMYICSADYIYNVI